MGASDFAKLPHIGESLRRKEDYRFLTGAGQYTDDIVLSAIDSHFSAPRVENSWTVALREDVTLHGTGVAPSDDAVREMLRVAKLDGLLGLARRLTGRHDG